MPDPIYRQHPDLFAFNTVTKKHMLRDGRAYKKLYTANPEHFVDSSSMFRTTVTPSLEVAPVPIVVTAPLPEVPVETKKHDGAREQVKAIISAEVTENPKVYAGKSKPELDSMFRTLLIARLTDTAPPPKAKQPNINKNTKPAKPATKPVTKPKKPKFKLCEVISSEDEGDESQLSESEA